MKRLVIVPFALAIFVLVGYHLLIAVDNRFRYGRMWETPVVRPHEEPLLIMGQGTVPFDGGEAIYRASEGETLVSPFYDCGVLNIEVIQEGKEVYKSE